MKIWRSKFGEVMTFDQFLTLVDGVHQTGDDRAMSRCPGHPDRTPSLSVRRGDDGRVLLNCFAGCTIEEICQALGITLSDLFADTGKPRDPVATREDQAWRNLERWRIRELRDVCDELRGLQQLVDHISRFLVHHGADLDNQGDLNVEDHFFYVDGLMLCHRETSALEERFELLHSPDPADHLAAYRAAGRPRVEA